MKIHIIVACDNKGGIAKDGKIPWYFKSDFAYFKRITMGNGNCAVIMGRKTWNSLPRKPLPGRFNMIVTRHGSSGEPDEPAWEWSIQDALSYCLGENYSDAFIIGGEQVYQEMMTTWSDILHSIYLTKIDKDYVCDQFFPLNKIEEIGMILEKEPHIEIVENVKLTYCHYIYPQKKTNINNELLI